MTSPSGRRIAQQLPDIPRWIEARDLLLSDTGVLTGLKETPELSFLLRGPDAESLFIIGAPESSEVRRAIHPPRSGGVIVPPEQSDRIARLVPAWARTPIILHVLQHPERLPAAISGDVAFLDPASLDAAHIPEELRRELRSGAERSPIAATIVHGRPVAFCYAGAQTESLWDVAIDTIAPHRRRGYAALCAAHMICHMQTLGKQPVWAAYEDYPPSHQLARKLGFVAIDGLVQFDPPAAP